MRKLKKILFLLILSLSILSCSSEVYQENIRIAVFDIREREIEKVIRLLSFDDTLGLFNFDKSSLKNSTITKKMIRENVTDRIRGLEGKLKVVGHTDSIGSHQYNDVLSDKRANSVAKLIVSLMEGDTIEMEIIGKGKREAAVPNNSVQNRRKNRRVEVFFIETRKGDSYETKNKD